MADEVTPAEGPVQENQTPALNEAEQAAVQKAKEGITPGEPNATPASETPAAKERPDYIPEKFWDAEKGEANLEALAKSYGELEKSQSAPKETEEAAAAKRTDGKVEKAKPNEAASEGEATPLQTAIESVREQYAANQEISDEGFKALEDAGIPREITELYLEGLKARGEAELTAIHSLTDGAENYDKMVEWAAQNLDDAAIDKFNDALDNPAYRDLAVKDLYSKFTAARPAEGKQIGANNQNGGTGDVFKNMTELSKAQADPRYLTDDAYRSEVVAKLQRSLNAGVQLAPDSTFRRTVGTFE